MGKGREPRRAASVLGGVTIVVALLGPVAPAPAAVRPPEPPMRLPPVARAAAAELPSTWIVGTARTAAASRLARRAGGSPIMPGAWRVRRSAARGLAARLRAAGLLRFAEPNVPARRLASYDGQDDRWARAAVVPPGLPLPPAGQEVGVVDSFVDGSHPDLQGAVRELNAAAEGRVESAHGTQVASVIAGRADGAGVTGLLPNATVVSYGTPEDGTCADSAAGISALSSAGVKVVNASYGILSPCFAEFEAIAVAYAAGTVVVAAAGNEFEAGNPVLFPAAWPHVLSVAAVGLDRRPAAFSSANAAIDLAAPGIDVPTALPLAFDTEDGSADGTAPGDGTSFAAPLVAGAAAWVRARRPSLDVGQVADALRRSADDVARPGWDADTGFGVLDVAGALRVPAPPKDPLEPNDLIAMVDGTVFRRPDPSVWRGNGRSAVLASVDRIEDPEDVYRLRVPGRARFKVVLRPMRPTADPDLIVLDRSAASTTDEDARIASSTAGRGRTDVVRLVNTGSRTRTAYVVVRDPVGGSPAGTRYRLDVVRQRRR